MRPSQKRRSPKGEEEPAEAEPNQKLIMEVKTTRRKALRTSQKGKKTHLNRRVSRTPVVSSWKMSQNLKGEAL